MGREFAAASTLSTVAAVWTANKLLTPGETDAFVTGWHSRPVGQKPVQAVREVQVSSGAVPAGAAAPTLSSKGLVAYGAGFGLAVALVRAAGARGRGTARRAAEIEVAEKTETKPVAYLDNIPRSIIEKKTVEKLLALLPKEQWDDPPEDSYLYTLKLYAETYGPGKATKMGWWDFWYMRVNAPDPDDLFDVKDVDEYKRRVKEEILAGKIPLCIPGPASFVPTGATVQWRGPERFAGDQVQSVVTSGRFAKQWLANLAFYREGLKPWQRGLEIGMAHGYFLIGPFVSLGPLRNTPEAATVGLLCGVAVVGIVSVGGLLFGSTIKPTRFDKEGDKPGAGFVEMINWHAVGGLGGAGFAHALLTVFGS